MEQTALKTAVNPEDAPARLIVQIFGEAGAMAIAGVGSEALRKWRRRRASGGGGGCIPTKYQAAYLRAAEVLGKDLRAEQLVWEPY